MMFTLRTRTRHVSGRLGRCCCNDTGDDVHGCEDDAMLNALKSRREQLTVWLRDRRLRRKMKRRAPARYKRTFATHEVRRADIAGAAAAGDKDAARRLEAWDERLASYPRQGIRRMKRRIL